MRFTIFLIENASDGTLKTQSGITTAFLQPQSDVSSSNPSSKTADSNSVVLTRSTTNPGQWYADITNPAPRYDLYINGEKQADFSGSTGFAMTSGKSLFVKKNLEITEFISDNVADFVTGTGQLATPDGGDTWPKFSSTNLPAIFVFPPSDYISPNYVHREIKLVKGSVSISSGNLLFSVSLDPNGPELDHYYFDLMIILL
jgi:hypothetical protein